jgi:hypothetical protein
MTLRRFGVFAPAGYLILAFPAQGDATRAREALLTGGYEPDEIMVFTGEQVFADIEKNRDSVSPLAYLGTEVDYQQEQLRYAKQGSTFLVVYGHPKPRRLAC